MDPGKVKEYKAYSNKLNRIIHAAKKNFFAKQFELNKENISLRTADAFPVVASLPRDDRKCVCCSQAKKT